MCACVHVCVCMLDVYVGVHSISGGMCVHTIFDHFLSPCVAMLLLL